MSRRVWGIQAVLLVLIALAAGLAVAGQGARAEDGRPYRTMVMFLARELPPPPPPPPEPVRGYIAASTATVWDTSWPGQAPLRTVTFGQEVRIRKPVAGWNWIRGDQTWGVEYQGFQDTWYELEGGGFLYSAWVYIPKAGEPLPWTLPAGTLRVVVETSLQELHAYVGNEVVFRAAVTTGKPGYETPRGSWTVTSWGRVEDELMSSTGFNYPVAEQYRVEHVLYTQYFTGEGHALHLNYWRPFDYFGNIASSHGCVGLMLHDAQWLWFAGYVGMPIEVR